MYVATGSDDQDGVCFRNGNAGGIENVGQEIGVAVEPVCCLLMEKLTSRG